MSFQDEYKITSADRLDKGVYGLPDTPGMTTAAIQERFDSLGNLAIDKFNALVDAASDVVDDSDTKFPTNKAVTDYISGQGGAIIDDTTPSLHKAYSSQKVENMFGDVASRVIDDTEPSSNKTYSSEEIEEKLSNIPSPESIIDDTTASADTTYSSSKLESDFISVSDTEEQTATDEFTTINGGLLSECKVALTPIQDLHGYDSPWVGGAGKNKLNSTLVTEIIRNGITCSPQFDDGGNLIGYQLSGTATANADFRLYNAYGSTDVYIPSGTYKANNTGAINGIEFHNGYGNDSYPVAYGNTDTEITCLNGISWTILRVTNGTVINTPILVQPMIRLSTESDPTFEPYTNICPISGHTEVKVGDDGKNKQQFPTFVDKTQNGITFSRKSESKVRISGTATGNAYLFDTVSAQFNLKQNTYTVSCNLPSNQSAIMRVFGIVNGTASLVADNIKSGSPVTFTLANDTEIFTQINVPTGSNFATGFDVECQIELGSTATAYVPYNGYQITVNLGGTYYSGTLDVVTGVFTPDTAKQTYPWGTYTRTDDLGNTRRRILATLSDALGTVSSDIGANISDSVDEQTGWTTDTPHFYIDSSNKTLVVFLPIDTPDSTNIEVCYKLATPTTIQLSPTMVKALVGENHLSAPLDGQEITESVYSPLAKWNAVIDDITASNDTTYSSNKINSKFPVIDDNNSSATKTFSSSKSMALYADMATRFDWSINTEKPYGIWTDGKVIYAKIIHVNGVPKDMFGATVDMGVEIDKLIYITQMGDASDDNYNSGNCVGGCMYAKISKTPGQNTMLYPANTAMPLSSADLFVLYTKPE